MSHLRQLTKLFVTNGKNIHNHKLQYFPNLLKRKVVDCFVRFEITRPTTIWDEVQWAFISRFSEVWSEGQAIAMLPYAKQKKYELIEDYYDWFLHLCTIIPLQTSGISILENF
jgi:hypothetical protein